MLPQGPHMEILAHSQLHNKQNHCVTNLLLLIMQMYSLYFFVS